MSLTIECQKRSEGSKPNALRREGFIPASLYGQNISETLLLTVNAKAAEFLVRDAIVRKSEIDVNIPDLNWNGKAVLQEVQSHPAKGFLYHLTFMAVK